MSEDFIRVDRDNTSKAKAVAAKIMSMSVRAIALRIQQRTQENIGSADLIDTGAMIASSYIEVEGELGREAAIAAATAAASNPGRKSNRARKFSSATTPKQIAGPFEARAGVAADYASLLNDGSDGGQVPAHKFFTQAVEDTKPEIKKAMRKIAKEVTK